MNYHWLIQIINLNSVFAFLFFVIHFKEYLQYMQYISIQYLHNLNVHLCTVNCVGL